MSGACTVVTGASGGIGEVVARRLIARGEAVLAVARNVDRLRALCGDAPHARFAAVDLERPDAVEAVARAVKEDFGAVRGFVHGAGFNRLAPLSLVEANAAQRLYALHVLFPMRFMGWLGKAPNHVAGTSCVLLSSLACRTGAAGNAAYAAAKGAVEALVRSAAAELAARGVRVNAVVPGFVETELAAGTWRALGMTPERIAAERARYPLGFGTPEQVADALDFLLGTASSWITGQSLVADGGRSLA